MYLCAWKAPARGVWQYFLPDAGWIRGLETSCLPLPSKVRALVRSQAPLISCCVLPKLPCLALSSACLAQHGFQQPQGVCSDFASIPRNYILKTLPAKTLEQVFLCVSTAFLTSQFSKDLGDLSSGPPQRSRQAGYPPKPLPTT